MALKKPTFFSKVMQTLSQLSATKGFSIKQIAYHLQQFGLKRDFAEIRKIVEQSLKYGLRNKLMQVKDGKYNLTPARLRCLEVKSTVRDSKKKRVRFKQGKTNITESEKKANKRGSVSAETKESVKSVRNKKKQSTKSEPVAEYNETKEEQETSKLRENNDDVKEPLEVTPEKDTHENCKNKNKDRSKTENIREPPQLESEQDIRFSPPRPPAKIIQRTPSRHSKERKDPTRKCRHHSARNKEHKKHIKDLIPDDKNYRKHKLRSSHYYSSEHAFHDHSNSTDNTRSLKRQCHRHNCCKRHHEHHHHSHHTLDDFTLKRKRSNTLFDHLNKSKHALPPVREHLTPFDVFLETNHSQLETIPENTSLEDDEDEANKSDKK